MACEEDVLRLGWLILEELLVGFKAGELVVCSPQQACEEKYFPGEKKRIHHSIGFLRL